MYNNVTYINEQCIQELIQSVVEAIFVCSNFVGKNYGKVIDVNCTDSPLYLSQCLLICSGPTAYGTRPMYD